MFKKGDIVYIRENQLNVLLKLTYGKEYVIQKNSAVGVMIINDDGSDQIYLPHRFYTEQEWLKIQHDKNFNSALSSLLEES